MRDEAERMTLRLGHQIYRRRKEAPVRTLEFFSDCCIWSTQAFLGRGNTPRSVQHPIRMRHIKGHTSPVEATVQCECSVHLWVHRGPKSLFFCAVCSSIGQITQLNLHIESVYLEIIYETKPKNVKCIILKTGQLWWIRQLVYFCSIST